MPMRGSLILSPLRVLLAVRLAFRLAGGAVFVGILGEPRHGDDPLSVADPENHDTLAAAASDPDVVDRATDHHAAIRHEHDLVVVPHREDRHDRVAAPSQVHVVEPLPAAPGKPVIVSRGSDAVSLFGDAEYKFLALREIVERLLGYQAFVAAVLAIRIFGLERRFNRGLALLVRLPPPPRR